KLTVPCIYTPDLRLPVILVAIAKHQAYRFEGSGFQESVTHQMLFHFIARLQDRQTDILDATPPENHTAYQQSSTHASPEKAADIRIHTLEITSIHLTGVIHHKYPIMNHRNQLHFSLQARNKLLRRQPKGPAAKLAIKVIYGVDTINTISTVQILPCFPARCHQVRPIRPRNIPVMQSSPIGVKRLHIDWKDFYYFIKLHVSSLELNEQTVVVLSIVLKVISASVHISQSTFNTWAEKIIKRQTDQQLRANGRKRPNT